MSDLTPTLKSASTEITFSEDKEKAASEALMQERFNRIRTSEILKILRKEIGYTYGEIAAVLAVHPETVKSWLYGRHIPNESTRFRIIETFTNPKLKPASKTLRLVKNTHHMHWEQERGWTVRFTITLNKKLIGQRRKIRLRTHNLEEALKRRDIALDCYKNLGFEIANRIQRRVKR